MSNKNWESAAERHEICKSQIARLGQMRNYPNSPESLRELVSAAKAANDPLHLARTITGFLESADTDTPCPMPKTLREALYGPQKWEPPAPPKAPVCDLCGDCGIVGGLVGQPPARWCECAAGRNLYAKEPNAVTELNESTAKLSALLGSKKGPGLQKSRSEVPQILRAISGDRT